MNLGVDVELTHSCYDPGDQGRPCGDCDSCLLRQKGFEEAGFVDPLIGPCENRRDILLHSRRRVSRRRSFGICPHIGLQFALRLVRHALYFLAARRRGTMPVERIVAAVSRHHGVAQAHGHTGGEPMIAPRNRRAYRSGCGKSGKHITIETAGTVVRARGLRFNEH